MECVERCEPCLLRHWKGPVDHLGGRVGPELDRAEEAFEELDLIQMTVEFGEWQGFELDEDAGCERTVRVIEKLQRS